jgi:hypothetical protein
MYFHCTFQLSGEQTLSNKLEVSDNGEQFVYQKKLQNSLNKLLNAFETHMKGPIKNRKLIKINDRQLDWYVKRFSPFGMDMLEPNSRLSEMYKALVSLSSTNHFKSINENQLSQNSN